jgi:type VI secretion system protein ImpL
MDNMRGNLRDALLSRYNADVLRECLDKVEGRYPFSPGSADEVALEDFGRVFGHGGSFDSFFRTTLQEYVDTTRNPWTWRTDATGRSAGGPPAMLAQFQRAQIIRETFFSPGSQKPELRFTMTPQELDASSTRFRLEVDGQNFEYRHGPEENWAATWPGPKPGVAAATFEGRSGPGANLAFNGTWAWFRLLNAGEVTRESDVRHVARFASTGTQARVRIEASTIRNPWATREWQQFRCGI